MATKTYFWDFFGPQGQGTATHFAKHVREFFERNGVEGCTVGTLSEREGHTAVRCVAPEAAWAGIERSLRPKRAE